MFRNCVVCDITFEPVRNGNAETCSNKCRQRLHRHRHGCGGSLARFKKALRPFTGQATVTSTIVDVEFGAAAQVAGPAAIAAAPTPSFVGRKGEKKPGSTKGGGA